MDTELDFNKWKTDCEDDKVRGRASLFLLIATFIVYFLGLGFLKNTISDYAPVMIVAGIVTIAFVIGSVYFWLPKKRRWFVRIFKITVTKEDHTQYIQQKIESLKNQKQLYLNKADEHQREITRLQEHIV